VGLRVRFCAQLAGLNSLAVLVLLTVPRRRPSVFLKCTSMLFHTVLMTLLLVSLVVFLFTVRIYPFASSLLSLIYRPPPSPGLLFTSPSTLWAYYSIIYLFSLNSLSVTNYFLLFNHLFVFFEFLIGYKLFILLVIRLSLLCLVTCPLFVWDPPGLLATGSYC
jgi:hypothetical protein